MNSVWVVNFNYYIYRKSIFAGPFEYDFHKSLCVASSVEACMKHILEIDYNEQFIEWKKLWNKLSAEEKYIKLNHPEESSFFVSLEGTKDYLDFQKIEYLL
jgi:hypothetical protein